MLSDFMNETNAALVMIDPSKKQKDDYAEQKFWSRMLKMMGLKFGVAEYLTFSKQIERFFYRRKMSKDKWVIITNGKKLSSNKGQIINVNYHYGLQESDLNNARQLLA